MFCFKRSEVSEIEVCNTIETLAEHDIHCLPSLYTSDAINMYPQQLWRNLMSKWRHQDKILPGY